MVVVARVRAAVDDVLVLAALAAGVVGATLWGVGVSTYAWNEICVCVVSRLWVGWAPAFVRVATHR